MGGTTIGEFSNGSKKSLHRSKSECKELCCLLSFTATTYVRAEGADGGARQEPE